MTNAQQLAVNEITNFEKSEGYASGSLLNVIIFETAGSLSPAARNGSSGATGLIQFMPKTALNLGTTTAALAAMSVAQQLVYVRKYLATYKSKILQSGDYLDIYLAVLYPVLIGKPDSAVMAAKPSLVWAQNVGLDVNKDGQITKGEIRERFNNTVKKYREKNGLPAFNFSKNSFLIPALVGAGIFTLFFIH